ncbi:MAG: hypothetical protein ACLUR5_09450 [Eubacterium ventriosum]
MKFYELPMGNIENKEIIEKQKIRELVEYERYCTDYGLKEQREKCWFKDGEIFTTWFKGKLQITLMQSLQKEKINRMKKKVMDTKLITQLYG